MSRLQLAQKAVVTDGDRVLLVKKSERDPYNPGRWELPGGRLQGREGLDDQVVREVREETGLTITPGPPIDMWDWEMNWANAPVRVVAVSRYCTLVREHRQNPTREADDFLDELRWVPRSELLSFDIIPSQLPTIQIVAAGETRPGQR